MKIVRSLEVRFFFFLFIRNEEKCINKRKDTREGKGVRIFLEWGVMDDKDTARGGVVFLELQDVRACWYGSRWSFDFLSFKIL